MVLCSSYLFPDPRMPGPVSPLPTRFSPEEKKPPLGPGETLKKRINDLFESFAREEIGRFTSMMPGDFLGNRGQRGTREDRQIRRVKTVESEWFIERVIPQYNQVDIPFDRDRRRPDPDPRPETPAGGKTTFRWVRRDGTWLLRGSVGIPPFSEPHPS